MSKRATSIRTPRAVELLPPEGWGPIAIHCVEPGIQPEPGSCGSQLEGLVFEVGKIDVGPEARVFGISGSVRDRPVFSFSGFYDAGRVISFRLTNTEEKRSYTFFGVRSGNRLAGIVKPDDNGETVDEEASWSAQAHGGDPNDGGHAAKKSRKAAKKSRK